MKRLMGLVVTGLLVLTACQSPTARSGPGAPPPAVTMEPAPGPMPPATRPPATQPAATQPPAPQPPAPQPPARQAPTGDLAAFCQWSRDQTPDLSVMRHYVETTLQGADLAAVKARIEQQPGTCLQATKGERTDVFLITGTPGGPAGWLGAVAWQEQGGWRAAPIATGTDMILPGKDSLVDGRPDLLLIFGASGTGGFRQLVHLSIDASGGPLITELTGTWGKASFEFLPDDLVLATHRSQLWEQFSSSCNGCTPSREQVLFRWDGRQLLQLGSRTQADPVLTLNLLRYALQMSRPEAAAALVSDPALLPLARQALPGRATVYEQYGPYPEEIVTLEAHNWDLLPPAVRTTLPPGLQTYFATVQLDAGTARIRLERRAAGWLVTGISLPAAAEATMTKASVTPAPAL